MLQRQIAIKLFFQHNCNKIKVHLNHFPSFFTHTFGDLNLFYAPVLTAKSFNFSYSTASFSLYRKLYDSRLRSTDREILATLTKYKLSNKKHVDIEKCLKDLVYLHTQEKSSSSSAHSLSSYPLFLDLLENFISHINELSNDELYLCIKYLAKLQICLSPNFLNKVKRKIQDNIQNFDIFQLCEIAYTVEVDLSDNEKNEKYFLFSVSEKIKDYFEENEKLNVIETETVAAILHFFAHEKLKNKTNFFESNIILNYLDRHLDKFSLDDLVRLLHVYRNSNSIFLVERILILLNQNLTNVSLAGIVNMCENLKMLKSSSSPHVMKIQSNLADWLLCNKNFIPDEQIAFCIISLHEYLSNEFLSEISKRLLKGSFDFSAVTVAQLYHIYNNKNLQLECQQLIQKLEKHLTSVLIDLPSFEFSKTSLAIGISAYTSKNAFNNIVSAFLNKIEKNEILAEQFCDIMLLLSVHGICDSSIWKKYNIDEKINYFDVSSLPVLTWCMAVTNLNSPLTWLLIARRINNTLVNPSEEQAELLYESFIAAQILKIYNFNEFGLSYKKLISTCKRKWLTKQKTQYEDYIARFSGVHSLCEKALNSLELNFKKNAIDEFGLYRKPFLLFSKKIVIDILAESPIHKGSGEIMGEIKLRHKVWEAEGYQTILITKEELDNFKVTEKMKNEEEKNIYIEKDSTYDPTSSLQLTIAKESEKQRAFSDENCIAKSSEEENQVDSILHKATRNVTNSENTKTEEDEKSEESNKRIVEKENTKAEEDEKSEESNKKIKEDNDKNAFFSFGNEKYNLRNVASFLQAKINDINKTEKQSKKSQAEKRKKEKHENVKKYQSKTLSKKFEKNEANKLNVSTTEAKNEKKKSLKFNIVAKS